MELLIQAVNNGYIIRQHPSYRLSEIVVCKTIDELQSALHLYLIAAKIKPDTNKDQASDDPL